jgi:hypothetical protein
MPPHTPTFEHEETPNLSLDPNGMAESLAPLFCYALWQGVAP